MSLSLPPTSRRDFLKTAATASLLAIPSFVPSTVLAGPGRTGANGKIRVGLIGAGGRARWLSRCMAREGARVLSWSPCATVTSHRWIGSPPTTSRAPR